MSACCHVLPLRQWMYSATAPHPPITTRSLSLRLVLRARSLVSLPSRASKSQKFTTTAMASAGEHSKKAEEHAAKAAEALGTHTKEQAKTFAEKVREAAVSKGQRRLQFPPIFPATPAPGVVQHPRRAREWG